MRTAASLVFVLALGAAACDDPLTRVDLIANLRVLGARVEVEGDPGRASPFPGENASVRWLVAARDVDPELGWAFAICSAGPPGSSLPTCAGEPFATASADVPVTGEPRLDFTVPDDIGGDALAVFGAVCPRSAPTFDGGGFGCEAGGGREVALDFLLERDGGTNTNPVLAPDALLLDGTSIPEGVDCASLPAVGKGSKHTLSLTLSESDRDPIEQTASSEPPKETLQLSHFTTAGALDSTFTVFEAGDTDLRAGVSWTAPKSAPPDGLVRFYFVVRDLRGGSDWIERAVCMGP
jgi:hypothetical protein